MGRSQRAIQTNDVLAMAALRYGNLVAPQAGIEIDLFRNRIIRSFGPIHAAVMLKVAGQVSDHAL